MARILTFLMEILVMCCWAALVEADYMKYKDPKQPVNVRIKDLMNQMTLEEKIGQMVQIERSVASAEVMKKYFIGSVLSGGGSVPAKEASAETWVNMVNDFQRGSLSTRLGIPMIYGIDAVHGNNNVYNATIFPHNVGLGATRDPELVRKIGTATALEVRATGIPYAFAPCIAVCRDPRWGRCYESYSEDHKIVQAMTEIIPGLQGEIPANSRKGVPFVAGKTNVVGCAKHYVGDGGTTNGINENNTVISRHGLLSIHMPAYYNSIIKGVATVMISYSSWNGIKMHANRDLITGFLKNTLRFRGFVISDWMGLDRITTPPHANYSYSIEVAIRAGIDMVMIPYNYTEFIDGLTSQVKSKIIPMSRIDDAVRRILRVKFVMGLFENPLADLSLAKYLGSQEHRELAREAVRKSLVLLKNGESADKPLLPLPKKASKILVAGSHADNLGNQCGGWTIEWQGLGGNNLTIGTTILTAIKNTVDPAAEVIYKMNPDANYVKSNKFSYAIVVVGEPPYSETFGDSLNLTIPEPGPSTIQNVCEAVKCIVIMISGRPLVIQPYLSTIDALVAAWLPGTEGQGVADVLFGDYGFTGNLGLKMARISLFFMGILVMCCWAAMAEAEYMKYKDPKQPLNVRIKDLMSRMTLEEKIGQMVQIDRSVASADVMKKYFIGSILSGGGSVPAKQASAESWINMVNDFQKGSLSTRLGIPMIYGIDAVHGHNNVYKATIFPHNIGLGATRDPGLVKKIGAATALEVRATGIPYVFAPCIAVCRDPRWGRCYESYSEDHKIVQAMTEIIPGLQGDVPANYPKGVPFVDGKTKVAACAKHFVGDGGTTKGINENNTEISMHELLSIHMPAYYNSIMKGVATVMISYSSWNGIKMHANHDLVTGFLKNALHFRGFVISDSEGIDKITTPPHANYTYSIEVAIHAGIDMVMVPYNYTEFINGLTFLVKNKIIPMSRIDDAVKRILRVKFVMHLFENPLADLSLAKYLGSQEHRELAREAVRKSLVLLKNGESINKPLLPLPKKASKILIAGSHVDNLGYQCGGWTIEWQGLAGNNLTTGTTILTAIKNTVDPTTEVVYLENPNAEFIRSNKFSYAIVVVGEFQYAETNGDSLDLTIPAPGPSTITNVCGAVKCVVVIISGRPVVIKPYLATIDALVAAWLPGTEGQGVADVLFGDYGFSGKLPHTWFKTVDQLPMNVGDAHYDPLFPFGFGLTTTPTKAVWVNN
ncbi:hypothetical protein F0562_015716 [Nyssa sinensis]|uniref:Beta-glucosidase n=1 Tax=Nyssa sinensis TaxID=561372 RepID=A0A5J4ZMV6_9ASTE|nr:hypothetical protein F0562_015716 [Nyssa sinensis]